MYKTMVFKVVLYIMYDQIFPLDFLDVLYIEFYNNKKITWLENTALWSPHDLQK